MRNSNPTSMSQDRCDARAPPIYQLRIENRLIERLAIVDFAADDELILTGELDRHRLAVHHDDAAVQVFGWPGTW